MALQLIPTPRLNIEPAGSANMWRILRAPARMELQVESSPIPSGWVLLRGQLRHLVQDLSAVTAACLMTWRDLYLNLGGLDECNFPVAFNDTDYCLRVWNVGYRVVWTPYADLFHNEPISRGVGGTPEKAARARREAASMRKRWRHLMRPNWNSSLSPC